jgi:metal-sulfur cluster biosynthetic enzyme
MPSQTHELEQEVIEALRHVIDPETGVDVVRMRLVEDLHIDAGTGTARLTFRPSSPVCPLAVHLALSIRDAVASVPGVTGQEITVVGYVGADSLNQLLRESI